MEIRCAAPNLRLISDFLQVAIVLIDSMGRGDTENGSEELDNLLLYLGLQLSHVQILNVKGKLTTPDIECLHVRSSAIVFIFNEVYFKVGLHAKIDLDNTNLAYRWPQEFRQLSEESPKISQSDSCCRSNYEI